LEFFASLWDDDAMAPSLIPAETVNAYRETHYRVQGELPCVLRVDVYCTALVELYKTQNVSSAAFITTACSTSTRRPLGLPDTPFLEWHWYSIASNRD
jgi:hypothetical protein